MVDLGFKLLEEIVHFWEFYTVSTIALLGWVFSKETVWSNQQKWFITIAFIGFAVFNLIGLFKSYIALEIVVSELKNISTSKITPTTINAMINRFNMNFWQLGIIFHLVIDGFVVYAIWSGQSVPRK